MGGRSRNCWSRTARLRGRCSRMMRSASRCAMCSAGYGHNLPILGKVIQGDAGANLPPRDMVLAVEEYLDAQSMQGQALFLVREPIEIGGNCSAPLVKLL